MSTIDNRVVQMEFENKNFEKNAKQSMKTLKDLDNSLEFKNGKKSFKDVEEAAQACDFKPLMQAVDSIQSRFSRLGIIGATVLQNITNSAINTGKQMLKSLTIDPIISGYSKYEEKTASVQTLMNSTGLSLDAINGYLSKLMWFSDETSYSFTQMTSALATMTSAGGDIQKLTPMLEGIANATAFAGKGAREFSGAIFNLNQSYSGGFLSYMDYNSLDRTYNMFSKQLKQAFIDSAKALGKLDSEGRTLSGTLVDINNFGTTLSEKWADREVMEKAFGWFGEATEQAYALVKAGKYATASEAYEALAGQFNDVQYAAAKSAQEAKTFKEAIDSVKDAVSSGWMQTFEYIFGNYEQSKVLWTDLANSLYDLFAEPGNQRNSVLNEAFTSSWSQFQEQITDTGIEWEKFQDRLIEYGKAHGKVTDEEIRNAKNLEEVIKSGWLTGDIVSEVLTGFTKGAASKSVEERLQEANQIAREIMMGEWGKGEAREKRLTEAGYDAGKMQGYVNTLYKKGKLALEDLGEAQIEQANISDEQREKIEKAAKEIEKFDKLVAGFKDPSGRDKMLQGIKNILSGLLPILDSFKLAWTDVFGEISADNITNFIDNFAKMSEQFKLSDSTLQSLRDTFGGVLAVIKFVIRVGKGLVKAFSPFFKLITNAAGKAIKLLGGIGNAVKKALGGSVIEKTADVFNRVFNGVVSVVESFIDFIGRAVEAIKEFFPEIDIISRINQAIDSAFSGSIFETVIGFLNRIKERLDKISKSDIREWFERVGGKIAAFNAKAMKLWQTIKTKLSPVLQRFQKVLKPVADYLTKTVVPAISGFVSEVINSDHPLQTLWEKIKGLLGPFESLKELFDNLKRKLNFSKWGDSVSGTVDEIQPKIEDFIKTIKEKLSGMDLTKLIAVAAIAAIASVIVTLNKALTGITGLSTSVKTFFTTLTKAITPVKGTQTAKNIATIAASIIALIGSLYLLGDLNDKGVLWETIGGLSALTAVLGVFYGAIAFIASKISVKTAAKIGQMCKGLLALAGSIVIMSAALFIISQVKVSDWEDVGKLLTLLAGTMAVLMLAVIGISRFGKTMPLKNLAVIAIALSLFLLAKALKKLNEIQLSGDTATFDTMAELLMTMFALALITRAASFSGMLGIAGAIGAVYLLMVTVDKLKTFDFRGINDNLESVILVIGAVIALYLITSIASAATKGGAKAAIAIAASLLLVVGSIWLMGKVLQNYSKTMDPSKIQESLESFMGIWLMVIGLMLTLGIASGISGGNGGFVKMGVGLLAMVGAIALLTLLLKSITKFIQENAGAEEAIYHAISIIGLLALIVSGMMLAAGGAAKLGGGKGLGYMITAVAMITAIIIAFYALQLIPIDQLLGTAAAIGLAMIAIGAVMLAMAGAVAIADKKGKGSKKGIRAMLAMVVPLIAVAASLFFLAQYPWGSLLAAAGALGLVMLAMGAAARIAGDNVKGGLALLAMAAPILAVAAALFVLASIPWQGLLKAGIAIVAVIGLLGLAAAILGGLGPVALIGAGVIAILSASMLLGAVGFLVFADALHAIETVDFSAIGTGLGQILGPLAILLAIGVGGLIAGPGLILLSVGMLSLAGSVAVLASSAIVASKALLFAKGAWDFLSGKGTESWELAVQMRNEANALQDESNNLQNTIDETTNNTTTAIDNYGDEVAKAYDEAGQQIEEAKNNAAVAATPEQVAELQNEVATGGGNESTAPDVSANAAKGMGIVDISSLINVDSSGLIEKVKEILGSSEMLAGLKEGLGGLLEGLDFSSADINLESLISSFTGGINTEENSAKIGESFTSLFSGASENAGEAGTEAGNSYSAAVAEAIPSTENSIAVQESGKAIADSANNGFESVDAKPSGEYFVSGIRQGVEAQRVPLLTYLQGLARECLDTLNVTWSVHSPSKETEWSSMQFMNGLVVGIKRNKDVMIYAIQDVAQDALTMLNATLDSSAADDPTIRPVLDMDNVLAQMDSLGHSSEWKPVITPSLDMSGVNTGLKNLNAISGYRTVGKPIAADVSSSDVQQTSPITFNQYNNSPKALSRFEIYRQTKNQLSLIEGVVRK